MRLFAMGFVVMMSFSAFAAVAPDEIVLEDGEYKVQTLALEKALSEAFKAEFRIQEFAQGALYYNSTETVLEPLGLSDHYMRTFSAEMKVDNLTHLIWCVMDYTYHDRTLRLFECEAEGVDLTRLNDSTFSLDKLLKLQAPEKAPAVTSEAPVS